jgi:hypothetical protein
LCSSRGGTWPGAAPPHLLLLPVCVSSFLQWVQSSESGDWLQWTNSAAFFLSLSSSPKCPLSLSDTPCKEQSLPHLIFCFLPSAWGVRILWTPVIGFKVLLLEN